VLPGPGDERSTKRLEAHRPGVLATVSCDGLLALGSECPAAPPAKEEKMDDTFDSTYVIRRDMYADFLEQATEFAITAYTIPAALWPELYKNVDLNQDIAMRVIWKPETTVRQIKQFDQQWFLLKY
jgi:hypothetical protein